MNWGPLFSSARHTWATPTKLVKAIEVALGWVFGLDAAALPETAVCPRYIAPPGFEEHAETLHERRKPVAFDAVSGAVWDGETVWLNPPYGRDVGDFVAEAARQVYDPSSPVKRCAVLIFMRSDTKWWHDSAFKACAWLVIKGRVKFTIGGAEAAKAGAPAPSVVLCFDAEHDPAEGPLVVPFDWRS